MSELDPAQVLEDAADLLLIRGRCKDVWASCDERCALGAIAEVSGYLREDHSVETEFHSTPAVEALLSAKGFEHLGDAFDWNDKTTDDFEVIDTLRHVAKDLRNTAVDQ